MSSGDRHVSLGFQVEKQRPLPSRPVRLMAALAYVVMFMPLLTISFYSFLTWDEVGMSFSLRWYEKMLANSQIIEVLWRSLWIAAATSTGAALLGTLGAVALERGRFPGRGLLNFVTLLPLAMPELILGLASLIWFVTIRLTLGSFSILLAHISFTLTYVLVTVRARLRDHDPAIEEAAMDLGARPLQVFWRVTLPMMLPGVAAGAMMAFTLSFDDFLISFFTAGVASDTLPMRIYSMIRYGTNREMYALSTVLFAVTATGLLIHHLLTAGRPQRQPA